MILVLLILIATFAATLSIFLIVAAFIAVFTHGHAVTPMTREQAAYCIAEYNLAHPDRPLIVNLERALDVCDRWPSTSQR